MTSRDRAVWLTPLLIRLLAGLLVGLLGVGAGGCSRSASPAVEPGPVAVESGPARVEPRVVPAVEVLRAWDRRRARAYARGSAAALRRLYVTGSAAGTADVALLRAYTEHGLRVENMRMQLLAVDVVGSTPNRWVLRVTDRLHAAVAVGPRDRVVLPRDEATTRVVTLRRDRAGAPWRVASVR